METKTKAYYIGLDIGTDSVGWAATDTDYKVLKFRGNATWGVELFDESKTAKERRMFRTARRRIERKRDRINWLQAIFDEEIAKIDPTFFIRLKESNLYPEDKSTSCPYSLFCDPNFNDAAYHRAYPTIYHLRKALLENQTAYDVRLVYLALHHIVKHRGHFLFDSAYGEGTDPLDAGGGENGVSFDAVFGELCAYLSDMFELSLACPDKDRLAQILKDRSLGKAKKKAEVTKLCGVSKKDSPVLYAVLSAISGASTKLCDLYDNEALQDAEIKSVDFSSGFEDAAPELATLLDDRFELLVKMKAVYDWALLADILDGETYLSYAKVKAYEKHRCDLKKLKRFVKTYCPDKYGEIFRKSEEKLCNYTAYSGCAKNGDESAYRCRQADFCKYLKETLPKTDDPAYAEMFMEITNGCFMPKQTTSDNGVIPIEVHRRELLKILENAKGYLPFLSKKDEAGLTAAEKVVSVFNFRIPYYVGPLNENSDKAWLSRKSGRITPWNFSNMVDMDKSAENFINNLTSKCTYLPDQDVIPKYSLLYSAFTVLDELNNLRINGEKISVSEKQDIFNNLFLKKKKVTLKAVKDYFKALGETDVEITGIDGDFKANLRSFIELAPYPLSDAEKEEVIKACAIFGDDKRLLCKRLTARFQDKLTAEEIKQLSRLQYPGWGRFSKAFLTGIYGDNPETGEHFNLIRALWETNDNHMVLLSSKYTFGEEVQKRAAAMVTGSVKEMVEALYVSPKVKRPIYQAVKIVQEIVKTQGCAPKKIFIEMARGAGEKKRTVSRKKTLLKLYDSCKKDVGALFAQLENESDAKLKQKKLYLYYTQLGRDMYTGERIDLVQLTDKNIYDIDHIFPRSKVKDDSFDNLALVRKVDNEKKGEKYPIDADIRKNQISFWKTLLDKKLISKTKFDRLTRATPLTDDELYAFINRQLVETRQSTKAVAQILGNIYPKENTEIVYVKAGDVSDFRMEDKHDMLKCREANDLHHAKDAYLNIVVGNVYNVRCTHNRVNFIKGLQTSAYSLNRMFTYDVPGAWTATGGKSLSAVKQQMNKNNILYTRYAHCNHGGFFDQLPLKKGRGQVPLKANSPRADIAKYGGYSRPTCAFFAFVQYREKNKTVKALVPIDLYLLNEYNADAEKYLRERCGLDAPKVLIPCVKYGACLSFDGCRMHISSKSNGGAQIVYKPGIQPVLGYELEKYIRSIAKFVSAEAEQTYTGRDAVSPEMNLRLFDELCRKMTETVMHFNLGAIGGKIAASRARFAEQPLKEQGFVLLEILKIMHANVLTGDLSAIGLAKRMGKIYTNNKLSEIKNVRSIKLINQSVTGLFESETVLI